MARPAVRDGSDPKAIRDTRVLVDCLQELVRGTYRPVRNCAKYAGTVWLADVPDGLVRRSGDADSRIMVVKHRPPRESPRLPAVLRGRVSVEAAATAAAQPPELTDDTSTAGEQAEVAAGQGEIPKALDIGTSEVRRAYEAWAGRWKRWAQEELAAEPHRRLYLQLYKMAKKIEKDGDTFEAVLAVGLLQIGAERASARVRRHVVTAPVTLTVDRTSVDIFTEVIRLTEHFRCMPEIIKWSSMQFYPDNQLVLLRQHGSDRLPPLKVVHLPEGHCEGRRDKLINRPEAEAVVDQLHRLTQDPAYAERSMGVIILRHGAQTRLVQDLVNERIDMPARERHNIQVGTPEEFQGDQRDVILLSMVVDGANVIAATGRHHERRFNVAASRARDQMWLFHSMTADQLSSKDLRHSLLTYMQSPPPPYTHARLPADVSADQLRKPFDSLFEQRVFLRIKERGYDVVPQWEVNGKRIDLVVTGDHGRLAVECDGSPYHSERQQIHDDAERERELRRAGWTFWRVRSSAFALSPEEALAPLWKRLTDLGIHPRTTPTAFTDDNAAPYASWTPVGLAEAEPDDEDMDPYDGEPDDDSEAA